MLVYATSLKRDVPNWFALTSISEIKDCNFFIALRHQSNDHKQKWKYIFESVCTLSYKYILVIGTT